MTYEARIGRWLLAIGIVAMGVQCLLFSRFVSGLEPIPKTFAMPWAWVSGGVLVAAGLSLAADRTVRGGALVLAAIFTLWTVVLHGPFLVTQLTNDADSAFHTLAIGMGALALAAMLGLGAWTPRARWAARVVFGLCTIGHGLMHFVFFKFTADFIPAWIPWHAFWAAATGVAQIAAGLAILSGLLARPAAILTGAMYASWLPLVHIPRVMAAPTSTGEWTDLTVVAALAASALLVAGLFPPISAKTAD